MGVGRFTFGVCVCVCVFFFFGGGGPFGGGESTRWEGMSKFGPVGGGFPHHPEGKTLYFVCSYHFT